MKIAKAHLLATLCILSMVSCKKQKSTGPANPAVANARLYKVMCHQTSADDRTYTITYNADNTVDSMVLTYDNSHIILPGLDKFIRKFSYFPDHYTISEYFPEYFPGNVGYTINTNANLITSIASNSDTILLKYDFQTRVISADDHHPGTTTDHGSYFPPYITTDSYNWDTKGNIDSLSSYGSSKVHYDYDMAKTGQNADMFRITQFLAYGRAYTTTKNVPVSYSFPNTATYPVSINTVSYFYEYDSVGRITKLMYYSGFGDTTINSYQYY